MRTWAAGWVDAGLFSATHYNWYVGKIEIRRVVEVQPDVGIQRYRIFGFASGCDMVNVL